MDELLGWSSRVWNRSWNRRMSRVEAALKIYMPAPNAMPMPTVAQIPAAVVMPITFIWRVKMTPAPRKPTAVTTPAAIREGASPMCSIKSMS